MALTPGEQALVARGNIVTSSFIPAESRARINAAIQSQQSSPLASASQPTGMLSSSGPTRTTSVTLPTSSSVSSTSTADMTRPVTTVVTPQTGFQAGRPVPTTPAINTSGLISKIYEDELGRALGSKEGDEGALEYWTSRLQSGATPEQLRAEIEGSPEGTVYDAYTGLLGRTPDVEGSQYWQQQLTTGALTPAQLETSFLQSEEFLGDVTPIKNLSRNEAILGATGQGSIASLGSLFYNARKSGDKLSASDIELIGYSRSPDKNTAYNFVVGGQAYAEGLEALDKAVSQGDEQKAAEIKNALADEQGFFDYYINNIAEDPGQAQINLRKETATGDVFGIGDPGKYVTTFVDRIGDATMDVVSNPYVQAGLALFGGPVGRATSSILQTVSTLDAGKSPSLTQWAATLAGVSELSGLEGGNWLDYIPEEYKETASAIKDVLDEGWDEAASAFKNATNLSTEELAKVEDGFRIVFGDETFATVDDYITGLGDDLTDLFDGQFGTLQDKLNAVEAALLAERQPQFTAQRGYQPGIDRPRLTKYEDSSVMAIMNQPSSIQKIG